MELPIFLHSVHLNLKTVLQWIQRKRASDWREKHIIGEIRWTGLLLKNRMGSGLH